MTEDRDIGDAMRADGWHLIVGDDMMWFHSPSRRVVAIGEYRFDQCTNIPAFPDTPSDASSAGYVVSCALHDEHGYPSGHGDCVWIESYGVALKLATKIRAEILAERGFAICDTAKQLTFDDYLEAKT